MPAENPTQEPEPKGDLGPSSPTHETRVHLERRGRAIRGDSPRGGARADVAAIRGRACRSRWPAWRSRAFTALAENVRDYAIFLMDPDGDDRLLGRGRPADQVVDAGAGGGRAPSPALPARRIGGRHRGGAPPLRGGARRVHGRRAARAQRRLHVLGGDHAHRALGRRGDAARLREGDARPDGAARRRCPAPGGGVRGGVRASRTRWRRARRRAASWRRSATRSARRSTRSWATTICSISRSRVRSRADSACISHARARAGEHLLGAGERGARLLAHRRGARRRWGAAPSASAMPWRARSSWWRRRRGWRGSTHR